MRILKRPMFKKGGSANEGIMNGLVDRKGYAHAGVVHDAASTVSYTHLTLPTIYSV